MPRLTPNPNNSQPMPQSPEITNVKPTLTRQNIEVGDYTYFGEPDFESHVTHHYEFLGDKLIIGKFCQIAKGVEFIMNGANHQMNAASTFPFYMMGWEQEPPTLEDLPLRGDTVVGNDVWIGQDVTILPGVRIGNGAIIGAKSVVASNVPPYTIAAGNPAREIRKRFDDEMVQLLERLQWWNLSYEKIAEIVPLLACSDLDKVKQELGERLCRR